MKKLCIVITLLALSLSCSCAEKPIDPKDIPLDSQNEVAATLWSYAENGLVLQLTSTDDLNLFEGASHTLLMCTYELSSREGFDQLAQSRTGLDKLLECGAFDASVVLSRRRIAHPGRVETMVMDRHENARFVAIVGGFYNMNPARAAMVKAIPLVAERDGTFWWSKRTFQPAVLNMHVELGADGLKSLPSQEE